jgi:hypothetical protein
MSTTNYWFAGNTVSVNGTDTVIAESSTARGAL